MTTVPDIQLDPMQLLMGFLYAALPYIALVTLVVGTILRYMYQERSWSTKSSEFLAKKSLKFANPIFHLGLLMVFGGHFVGILVPKFVTEMGGTDDHMYHMISLMGGLPAGALLLLGFVLLMVRRFATHKSRLQVNTSSMDKLLYLVLAFTIVTGCLATLSNIPGGFDYRESISPWFRSVLMLSPNISLMADVPLIFRAHMLSWMLLALLFPFTRLVHCLSFPFEYFLRKPIVYRQR